MPDDVIGGSVGNDGVFGDAGNDVLYGSEGNDFVSGGDGNDVLWGGADDDFIDAGNGDDFIGMDGGDGNDAYQLGAGNDRIMFRYGAGRDTVFGFNDGQDVIDFSATDMTLAILQANTRYTVDGTLMDLGSGSIFFDGIAEGAIDWNADFAFAAQTGSGQ